MKIEKKLIASSILALLIGVSSVVPLLFLMSGTAKAETPPEEKPQFSLKIPYAYISNYWDNSSQTNQSILGAYGYIYSIVFEAAPNFDIQALTSDAIVEYYLIEISSDKGPIGNVTYLTGINANPTDPPVTFRFSREQWFDSNSFEDAFLVSGYHNGTFLGFRTGPGANWTRSSEEPETIFISVRRQGWIILNNNSTTVYLASPEPILQIQLEKYEDKKYGGGFLYNTIIPEDELAQLDPLMPQLYLLR